jgi:hypothetical protein
MKKIAIAMLFSLMFSFQAVAETFTYVVPAGPDGGNGKWAQNFVKQWDKKTTSIWPQHGNKISTRSTR